MFQKGMRTYDVTDQCTRRVHNEKEQPEMPF